MRIATEEKCQKWLKQHEGNIACFRALIKQHRTPMGETIPVIRHGDKTYGGLMQTGDSHGDIGCALNGVYMELWRTIPETFYPPHTGHKPVQEVMRISEEMRAYCP